jgi:hypothetical protein
MDAHELAGKMLEIARSNGLPFCLALFRKLFELDETKL